MNYQWYPGHMTKAVRMMQEDVKLVDLIIEIIDARIPISSRNPDINNIGKGKSRVILMNKSDLSDPLVNREWTDHFNKEHNALLINSKNKATLKDIEDVVKNACKEKLERDKRRGIINRPIRAMVVGIPNVGKSTFINSFAGKACAKTGNKPGVTKGKQWIRLSKSLELLDTPGILWPKFESQTIGKNLSFIGSINDDILDRTELALELIDFLKKNYSELMVERYALQEEDIMKVSDIDLLNEMAVNRKFLMKGNEADISRMADALLDDFRSGRIGRISIESPKDIL